MRERPGKQERLYTQKPNAVKQAEKIIHGLVTELQKARKENLKLRNKLNQ